MGRKSPLRAAIFPSVAIYAVLVGAELYTAYVYSGMLFRVPRLRRYPVKQSIKIGNLELIHTHTAGCHDGIREIHFACDK